jgi:hypothetical protein
VQFARVVPVARGVVAGTDDELIAAIYVRKSTEPNRIEPLSPEAAARVRAERERRKVEQRARKQRGKERAEWIAMNKAVIGDS